MSTNSLRHAETNCQAITEIPDTGVNDDRWLHALAWKQQRDFDNEGIKESLTLAIPGELRAGGKLAKHTSRVSTDASLPDTRKARRILARYGSRDAIQEHINENGYECSVDDFIARFNPGGRRPLADRDA